MLFPSPIFLFLFLPLALFGYFVIFRKFQNIFLLIISLLFYAWGEGLYVLALLAIIGSNYLFGLLLGSEKLSKLKLGLFISFNLLILFYFKYFLFVLTILAKPLAILHVHLGIPSEVHMPLGISFITFHTISYLFDIYRKKIEPEKNLLNLSLYITLFPHLIAGPIVRYFDIGKQIKERQVSLNLFVSGVYRFSFGLGKKVIIANVLASMADRIFKVFPHLLSPDILWLGLIAYALQIYFDFSGYSDMAIGLAQMFGFRFAENFNYPYLATSVQDFWRRWHMTLSSWFRDYLYIPLGGNRKGRWRTVINILIVFSLTGLWHGASWHFLFWGFYFGVFLALENLFLAKVLNRVWFPIRHFYALLVILIGWLFFRIDNLSYAFFLFKLLFGIGRSARAYSLWSFLSNESLIILIIALILAFPTGIFLKNRLKLGVLRVPSLILPAKGLFLTGRLMFLVGVLVYSIMQLASNTYNPFIYFRF